MGVDEQERGSNEIRMNISPRESHDFVKKLAREDDFRTALQERPLEVLREHNIEVPVALIPTAVELPPPDAVEELLAEMAKHDEYGKGPQRVLPFIIIEKIKEKIRRWKHRRR